ncbi:Ankyrin repeat-containing domain [Phytophthora cactorum]|nr:Ankyrin repeat-containing domain [Phytophthora cactorum]
MVLHGSSSSLSSVATDKRSMAYSSSNNSATLHKFTDDPSSFGSMLDQLHAEQKGTIEALTCQVEFYRQREERARQELVTLRRCLPLAKSDDASASVAKLASENRALGDELDALRAKKSGWDRDRARLERQKKELERQLKDAKSTLTSFSQAIEQLEIKMQRKEAEVQTRCLELEHELDDKAQECEQLQQNKVAMQQQLENLQTASDENARLRNELRTLLQTAGRNFSEHARSSRFSSEINSISEKFSSLEDEKCRQETEIQELQQRLTACAAEVSAAQLEVERRNSEIKEMQLKLDNSTSMLTLREQLLASDDSSRKEVEAQRQELATLVSTLQREKGDLQSEISSLYREQEATKAQLQTAKSRLSAKDHSLLVSTLRSEVASLKERLRSEFMHEKDSLKSEVQSLKQEITLLRGRLAEKDLAARNLENELLRSDEKQKQTDYDIRQFKEQIYRLETELVQSRTKYQQLQQCRTSLELLNDEESAASAHEELEKLRNELSRIKKENAALETDRQTFMEEQERIDRINRESSTHQNEKIDELYRQLMKKEEIITSLKNAERLVALLQQEKESWEGNVTDVRLRCESRVESEVRKADGLRSRIEQLEQDKVSLKQQIDALEEESATWNEKMHASELSLRQKDQEVENLKRGIACLEGELADATQRIDSGRQEITACEQKLLKERKKMEREMIQLVHRIEIAGQRNFELGEKVIALANQSKVDQTDLVALSSQVKSYKDQVKTLESQIGQIHRRNGQESDTVPETGRCYVLEGELSGRDQQAPQALEHVQSDYSVAMQQRDEAVKRVRLLVQCREEMKATAEDHTTELVEEIEALQHQMDSERKRCAVLLANEKTLLRDLQERNSAITKLQRTVSVLQHQIHDKSNSNDRSSSSTSGHRRRSRGSSNAGSPVSSSNQSTVPTTSSLSPHRNHRRQSEPQPQPQPQQLRSSSASSSGSTMTPAKEMEHLLSNLEHISDFSAQTASMSNEHAGDAPDWMQEQAAEYQDLVGSFVESVVDSDTDEILEYQLIWEGGDLGVALTTLEGGDGGVAVSRVTGKGFPFGIKNVGPGDLLLSINMKDTTKMTLDDVVAYLQVCDLPATLRFKKLSPVTDQPPSRCPARARTSSPAARRAPPAPWAPKHRHRTLAARPSTRRLLSSITPRSLLHARAQDADGLPGAPGIASAPECQGTDYPTHDGVAPKPTPPHPAPNRWQDYQLVAPSSPHKSKSHKQKPASPHESVAPEEKLRELDGLVLTSGVNDLGFEDSEDGSVRASRESRNSWRDESFDVDANHGDWKTDEEEKEDAAPVEKKKGNDRAKERFQRDKSGSTLRCLDISPSKRKGMACRFFLMRGGDGDFSPENHQPSPPHASGQVRPSDVSSGSMVSSLNSSMNNTMNTDAPRPSVRVTMDSTAPIMKSHPIGTLHEMCAKGNLRGVVQHLRVDGPEALLNREPNHGQTGLHLAVKSGKVPLVKVILEQYKPLEDIINVEDDKGNTALHFAATKTPAMVHLLLENGASANVKNSRKFTPLIISVITSKDDSVIIPRMLLKFGANPNDMHDSQTVIHTAISTGRLQIAGALVRAGAKMDVEDAEGKSVFEKLPRKDLRYLISQIYFPPTYITRKERTECMLCRQKFKFGHREHNCTHCGRLCCAECSALHVEMVKFPMGFPGRTRRGAANREQKRVCKTCYNVFKERNDEPEKSDMTKFINRVINIEWDEVNPRSSSRCRMQVVAARIQTISVAVEKKATGRVYNRENHGLVYMAVNDSKGNVYRGSEVEYTSK